MPRLACMPRLPSPRAARSSRQHLLQHALARALQPGVGSSSRVGGTFQQGARRT